MSWPLASFAIVLGVLAAGWLAYERSRPSARTVAVVGTLAALAALGRDAFAALPDVKPITAMTLVVGYALGPLPGFAVGAIGMLASNLVLGEGSYTPWQMAAWGMVGLAGAGLGALSGRRMGRVPIALACAVTAMAAKEVMNVYTWTLGASHTPAALLAAAGAALPFDVTDAVASFLFGLAFGPELARLLARMRERMTVTWQAAASGPLTLLALAACVVGVAAWSPRSARASSAQRAVGASGSTGHDVARAVAFMEAAQNADGGFGGAAGQRSSELFSAWAALGLAAAGRDPARLSRDGHTVLDAIRAEAATIRSTGDVERTILALHACGAPLSLPGAGDLLARLLRSRATDGSFERLADITSFAVFSLRASGRPASDPVVRTAGAWLMAQQNADGGFGYATRGRASDVDDTAAAVQAAIDAGGAGSPAVGRAVAYLLGAVNRDGGLPQQPGGESNAQSTAWAVQALVADGRDPGAAARGAARSPLAYLAGLVAGDGSVPYSRSSSQTPVWVTAQALTALAGRPFPIPPASSPAAGLRGGAAGGGTARGGATRARARAAPSGSGAALDGWRPRPAAGAARHGSAVPARVVEARLNALARAAGALVAVVLSPVLE